METAKTEVSSV